MDEYHSRPKYTEHGTELENPTQLRPWPEIQFDYKEEEIKKLLKPGYSSLRQKGHLGT